MPNPVLQLRGYGPAAPGEGVARFMPRTGYLEVLDHVNVAGFDDLFSLDTQVVGFNSFMVVSTVTGAGAFTVFCYIGHPEDSSNVVQRTTIVHAGASTLVKSFGAFGAVGTKSDVPFFVTFEYINGVAGARIYTLRLFAAKR